MIAGEPRVIERDGEHLVVDENGDEVVCRRDTSHPAGFGRMYHRIETDAYAADRTVRPACDHVTHQYAVEWLPRRKADLSTWNGCSYRWCYGDYDPHDSEPKSSHSGLAATLDAMSVKEFDAIMADDQGTIRPDGGER